MCWRPVDLRLLAWHRLAFSSACLCRSFASRLIRYCVAVRPAGGLLAWLSRLCCCGHRSSCVIASFDFVKAFQSVRFSIPSSIGCVRRCHVPTARSLSAYPFRYLSHPPVPRLRTDGAIPGSAFRLPCRLAARLDFRFLVPPLCLPDGEGRSACGELDETARVPMIGWRRFPFSRHLVSDTG